MPQYTQGGVNPAAIGVPDLYINIQPPPAAALPGAPSNQIGIIGSATWGPVNAPVVFGDLPSAVAAFGQMQNRKYDLVTQAAVCTLQGANAFLGVRVTDGTDVAASVIVQTNCITLTAKYTGTRGNSLQAVIASGTAASSYKVTLSLPGLQPETFDNITGSGNAFWVNLANAINNGQNAARGASQLIIATAGAGTSTPSAATLSFSGGLDGASSVSSTTLIGSDSSRTGIYALRNTGAAIVIPADADSSTSWSTFDAYAKSELCIVAVPSPAGDSISNFATTMASAGIDDPWVKVILGDWVYFNDGVNSVIRLVSPAAYWAGRKAALGPHRAALNQPLYGVVGTQKSYANQTYSAADLQALSAARGDVITAPSVGGAYFSCRMGFNSCSDRSKNQENWTTMTNYLARSMGQGLGQFVGRLITKDQMREASSAIGSFLENEKQAGRIDSYSVQIDASNNPSSQTALGVEKATVLVRYLSTLEFFLVDFTGGMTVTPASSLAAAA